MTDNSSERTAAPIALPRSTVSEADRVWGRPR